jgi:hypothetical protein
MRRVSVPARLLAIVLAVFVTVLGLRPAATMAQDDAARFADLLAQRGSGASLAGPLTGQLVQQNGFTSVDGAGVVVDSFSATATFQNPQTPGNIPWDFGFDFHRDQANVQQMVIDSDGNWYYSPYPAGTQSSGFAPMVDSSPGGTNTVDLIVDGDTAYLGINGEFVSSVTLPPAVSSDVEVATGFFTGTVAAGRVVAYRDFQVWPVTSSTGTTTEEATPPSNIVQITTTPQPVASPETGPGSDAETFASILASQAQVAPIAGPFTANLKEESDRVSQSWAGVNVDTFHAHATFDVPQATSQTPWDVGFTFLTSPNGSVRLAIDSLGNWYYSVGTGGPSDRGAVSNVATSPGGTNTLDLLVASGELMFGVNGDFVAKLDLPSDATASDVAASAALYSDQTQPDRIIEFHDFVVLPLDANALTASSGTAGGLSQADRDEFAGELANIQAASPAVGPFAGRLVEASSSTVPQAAAGISLADFSAVASFTNPSDLTTAPWDAGFQFRSQGDQTHRIVISSTGDVHAVFPDGTTTIVGTAASYNATPGAVNEVQLFVHGGRALVGVNGELVSVITLPATPIAADILVGSSFFSGDFVQGRVTGYQGFSVWETT